MKARNLMWRRAILWALVCLLFITPYVQVFAAPVSYRAISGLDLDQLRDSFQIVMGDESLDSDENQAQHEEINEELMQALAMEYGEEQAPAIYRMLQNLGLLNEQGEIVLPAGVKLAISMMIQAVLASGVGTEGGGDAGMIESERIGQMQQTFRNPAEIWTTGGGINGASGGSTAPWFALLKPYRRIRFVPSGGACKRDDLPCP